MSMLLYTSLTKPPKFGRPHSEKYPCLERPEKAAAKMTVNVRSRRINPRITAPTVVKLMPSIVLETELRRGSRSLTVVCLFSMEWAWGAARDIWDKASKGSNIIIIFVGNEIIVLVSGVVVCYVFTV